MGIDQLLKAKRAEILAILLRRRYANAAKHGAHGVRAFGSVARGEANADSDVDSLVDVNSNRSSWFPVGLMLDLEDLLGRKVA